MKLSSDAGLTSLGKQVGALEQELTITASCTGPDEGDPGKSMALGKKVP